MTARLAEGKSLRAICSEAGMRGRAVFHWIGRHKEFRDEYTLKGPVAGSLLAP